MRRLLNTFSRYRPRVLTVLLVAAIAALLVLANLSDELRGRIGPIPANGGADLSFDVREPSEDGSPVSLMSNLSYGWPLVWRQYVVANVYGAVLDECRSTGRLAGNVALWLTILVVPAALCEWLLRRYRPRLRWSLKAMLIGIGLVAAGCGWFVHARNRANIEDALIADVENDGGRIWVERWGPDWLELIGADRLRRRIIGAHFVQGAEVEVPEDEASEDEGADGEGEDSEWVGKKGAEDRLARLAQVRALRYLMVVIHCTPGMIDSLGQMRRLQSLNLDIVDQAPSVGRDLVNALANDRKLRTLSIDLNNWSDQAPEQTSRELLAVIGKLTQIESLRLEHATTASESLAGLSGLTNLKSLTLDSMRHSQGDAERGLPLLSRLPKLEGLESLDLHNSDVGDRDLPYLASLPRLKSLSLVGTHVTGTGLAKLAALASLEELAINGAMVSEAGLESLSALSGLRALHIDGFRGSFSVGVQLNRDLLRTIEALRQANPKLVIDGDREAIGWPEAALQPSEDENANRGRIRSAREILLQWKTQQATIKAAKGG